MAARPAAGQTRDLVVLGAAQLVGTLLGFLLGLLACGLAGWLVLRRTGWSRLEPIVRLEVSGSTLSLIEGIQSRVAATGSAIGQPVPGCPGDPTKPGTGQADRRVGATTAVADFADQALPLAGLFVEEHAKQADERRRQEQEILQRVLADNLALQQQISARAPAA